MSEQAVTRRSPGLISGVALALALALATWTWLRADGDVVDAASGTVTTKPVGPSAVSSVPLGRRTATAMPPASVWAQPSARTPFAVPITLAAPQKLQVGEMNDLIVSVGPNGDVGEVSFKLLFDPNILQVRIGTEGDWGAGAGADARSFAAEISDEGDRAQVRRSVSDLRAGVTGGGVAILRFQAVAAGSTEVLMTDVVVKDLAGRSIASAVSAPRLHVTVDAAPPRQPDAGRRFQGVEPNAETRGQGD